MAIYLTEDVVKKYINEQVEESRKEDTQSTVFSGQVILLATPSFWASSRHALFKANIKPPVELVVADFISILNVEK